MTVLKKYGLLPCLLLGVAQLKPLHADEASLLPPSPIKALLPDDFSLQKQLQPPPKDNSSPSARVFDSTGRTGQSNETFKLYIGSHLQPSYVDKFAGISAILPTERDNESLLISPTFGIKFYLLPNLLIDAQTDLGYMRFSGTEFQNIFDNPASLYIKEESVPLRTDATLKFLF